MARLERFMASMVFCEAPLEGTFPPLVPTGSGGSIVKRHTGADDTGKKHAKNYFSGAPAPALEKERPIDRVAQFLDAAALE